MLDEVANDLHCALRVETYSKIAEHSDTVTAERVARLRPIIRSNTHAHVWTNSFRLKVGSPLMEFPASS